eukprot:5013901-Pyramimonas_sp.AAC.1
MALDRWRCSSDARRACLLSWPQGHGPDMWPASRCGQHRVHDQSCGARLFRAVLDGCLAVCYEDREESGQS